MKNTRFMEVLFSAVEKKDEELADQVANDIESAKANGSVDTEEVKYENLGDGKVAITDKGSGEVTIAEKANDEEDTYDLYPAMPDEQIEGFIHPESDGVTPGDQVGARDEKVEYHMDGSSVISPNMPCGNLNPRAGHERSVVEVAQEGPQPDEEREFSVYSDNYVVQRIFSDQEFCERVFSEVIESEETAVIGDLKVEKDPEEENSVVVTSESTGDQAKVKMDGEDMEVTELDSKNFSNEDQYDPFYVVGVDPINHVIVDAPEYTEESANELVNRLTEQGVDAVQILNTKEEARDYAIQLLSSLGVESEEDVEEPEQAEFSDHSIYLTKFYSDNTDYMCRLFSEAVNDVEDSQRAIEDAIGNGDQIETDTEVITPIDSSTAVVEDKENGEFTKVSLDGEDMKCETIDEDEADDLTSHIEVDDEGEDEDEKDFSDVYCDEYQTKFFSENEEMTNYMIRLFSEESDSEDIEKAIEEGKEVETDTEVITPISDTEAIIEDKENGELTKAEMDDDKLDINPISEEEASELTDEKDFSDVYCDEYQTKFFSENEEMTNYMIRLFSEESDSSAIEDAIENGDQIETDTEVITPIDSSTAVVEDKENGEFTKAEMDDDKLDINPISEEEADELTKGLAVEDEGKDEDKCDECDTKTFSLIDGDVYCDEYQTKFFSENEEMTNYMIRLFSEESDSEDIEKAIEEGKEVETDTEVITPISDTEAVVEDKENGEFTKAEINDSEIEVHPLTEEEANKMVDECGGDDCEKKFSDPILDKFFSDIEEQSKSGEDTESGNGDQKASTVEEIEDKALAAIQSIRDVTDEATGAIMEAKQAPVEGEEEDLKEAQFSEKEEDIFGKGTLVSWLSMNKLTNK